MRNFLLKQGLFLVLLVAGFLYAKGGASALAALYGGATALAYALVQRWHMRRSARSPGLNAARSLRLLYRCAFERLAVATALLAIGLGVLKLAAAPLVIGFIAGVTVQLIDAITNRV